ncbi:MAG: methyltransferase domain-containing protein [Nanoarchaeota archaeon]|nr:methyltransferase domain-containing protein [Nanoarchaeota archaeon]
MKPKKTEQKDDLHSRKVLNLGSGNDTYGDVRMDVIKRPNVTHVGNIEKRLPFKDNTFDEVYCRQVFEHFPNPLSALLEMKRVCKKGGRIRIITDNGGCILLHYNLKRIPHGNYSFTGREVDKRDMHYMFFQPEHLRNFFWKAGIKPTKITLVYSDKWLGWKEFLLRKFLRLFLGKRLAYQNIIAEAVK